MKFQAQQKESRAKLLASIHDRYIYQITTLWWYFIFFTYTEMLTSIALALCPKSNMFDLYLAKSGNRVNVKETTSHRHVFLFLIFSWEKKEGRLLPNYKVFQIAIVKLFFQFHSTEIYSSVITHYINTQLYQERE